MDYSFALLYYYFIIKVSAYILAVTLFFGIFHKYVWKKLFGFGNKLK